MLSTARSAFLVGATAGALEALVLAFRKLALGQLVFVGNDFWWLNPIILGTVASGGAVIAALATRPARPDLSHRAGLGLVAMILAANTMLLLPRLHTVAMALGTLGLGWRVGILLDRHWAAVDRVARRVCLPMLGVLMLSGLAWRGAARWLDRPAGATDVRLPNVLLIILDTVGAADLKKYGLELDTSPFLADLARRGVRFEQAYSVAPWTGAGHAGLFTGRWADETSISWVTPLDGTHETLAEALAAVGYRTAGVVANTEYASRESGVARGFQFFSDYRTTAARMTAMPALGRWLWRTPVAKGWLATHRHPNRVGAEEVNRVFLDWLDRGAGRTPFFGFLNYFEAHAPYFPPHEYWTRFVGPGNPQRLDLPLKEYWPPSEVAIRRRAYGAAIAYLDEKLAELFSELDRRELLTSTIVIVTSDHGEEFYEHRVMGHANSIHVQGLAVPLLIAWPGRLTGGYTVQGPVSTRRVPSTVLGLIGRSSRFPGRPLFTTQSPNVVDDSPGTATLRFSVPFAARLPPSYPVSHGPLSAVLQQDFWYLTTAKGDEKLYDALADPTQLTNLAGAASHRGILERLRSAHRDVFP